MIQRKLAEERAKSAKPNGNASLRRNDSLGKK
jgi:hypothetical protein